MHKRSFLFFLHLLQETCTKACVWDIGSCSFFFPHALFEVDWGWAHVELGYNCVPPLA